MVSPDADVGGLMEFAGHLIMEREVLAYLAWKASGLTLQNPRPRTVTGQLLADW